MEIGRENLIAHTSIEEYFQSSLCEALHNQKVEARAPTIDYVANLLIFFSRSENFFDRTEDGLTLKPLATFYAEAVEGETPSDRDRALKRLGDVALFVSGVLADSLNRKTVDVDYYVSMGGSAYAVLADAPAGPFRSRHYQAVFNELSQKFIAFVDVLAEVTERGHLVSDQDVLRLYEIWLRTGSKRAAAKLRRIGIHPSESTVSRKKH